MVQMQWKGKLSFPTSLGCREPVRGLASQMKGHDLHVPFLSLFLSTGTLREPTKTPGLMLYFLPSHSHSPVCQHTSLSLSLTCKRRANRLANTVALGFWSSNEDLMETYPTSKPPVQPGRLVITSTSLSNVTCVISGKRTLSSVFQIVED